MKKVDHSTVDALKKIFGDLDGIPVTPRSL